MSQQKNPAWTLIDSHAVKAIAYDEETETLFVRFPNGSEYLYENVTKSEHAGLTSAGSIGQYFCNKIRKTHPFRKLTPSEEEEIYGH